MSRVSFEELEPSEDCLLMHYAGEPFNGVAFESDDGILVSETNFLGGQKSGVSREWSSTGRLVREQHFALNSLHGQSLEWYENGTLKLKGNYELGICIHEQEWDANGNLIREYRIDEEGPQFLTLQKLRKSNLASLAERA